jgi:hypothetical protein
MFDGDICWRIIHNGRIATLSCDANSSRVRVFDSETIIRVWPFSVIGVWSILLRSAKASVGASKVNLLVAIFSAFFLRRVENQDHQKPISPRCLKCGEQRLFSKSMPDPPTGRTFHMFECQCGNRTWTPKRCNHHSEHWAWSGVAVLARHHDADDCDKLRQRPPDSGNRRGRPRPKP